MKRVGEIVTGVFDAEVSDDGQLAAYIAVWI